MSAKEKTDQRIQPMMRLLKTIHSLGGGDSTRPQDLQRQRLSHELLGRLITPMIGMSWEPFDLEGLPAAWTRPDKLHSRHRIILYCHGGGYTCGALNYARILSAKLAHATGRAVLSFQYRLAPENPYPAALEDALRAWDYLMRQGYGARDVVVAGDSAGGNMALCLTARLKEQGRLLPQALVLMSPWTDLSIHGRSYQRKAEVDPILTQSYLRAVRAAYAGEDADFLDPRLSPLYGPLQGFPPTLIQVGECEILLSDALRLDRRLRAAGGLCRAEVWRGMWHVFQLFPIRQAAAAMENVARYLREIS